MKHNLTRNYNARNKVPYEEHVELAKIFAQKDFSIGIEIVTNPIKKDKRLKVVEKTHRIYIDNCYSIFSDANETGVLIEIPRMILKDLHEIAFNLLKKNKKIKDDLVVSSKVYAVRCVVGHVYLTYSADQTIDFSTKQKVRTIEFTKQKATFKFYQDSFKETIGKKKE